MDSFIMFYFWESHLAMTEDFFVIAMSDYQKVYHWLVVLTILKNMKVNGKDYPIYDGK